ncbi:MAG TPA: leucyl aminopeptidase family protein [Solirubrobacteraceae bacterium]|nr:leucyl aminopeptidase family protein [Solirubrobacteraceae bacterium]
MDVSVMPGTAAESAADTLVVGVFDGQIDALSVFGLERVLSRGVAKSEFRHVAAAPRGEDQWVIVVGLGAQDEFDAERARIAAAVVRRRAVELRTEELCWQLPEGAGDEIVAALVTGTILGAYRFDRFKPGDDAAVPQRLTLADGKDDHVAVAERAKVLAEAQNRARDLANAPPNEMTPSALADYAVALADRHDAISATVLDGDEIRHMGMGAFAAVAQGSDTAAKLVALTYEPPAAAGERRLALVGKAVTFDSGGYWLKPTTSQITMKFDMAGGAAVIETVAALAELRAAVRVLAVVGATENMISGAAMRPGDVLRALDGTTIEMNNSDAEGRLVLADCITWAKREGCDAIVDIATLTGAAEVALGPVYAAVLSNDEELCALALGAGERTGERLWRLPLDAGYAEMIKGRYAQIANRSERRGAGASTAAELLHHFVGDTPWAHLDIAGVADNATAAYLDKGGTGFGVRLLSELALSF